MFMFMGLVARMFDGLVASSSLVGGPRTLQNVSHFKVFGCTLYIHIVEKWMNLEPSFLKGILVLYTESFMAYKVYVPSQRKIVVIQYVKVDEDACSSIISQILIFYCFLF